MHWRKGGLSKRSYRRSQLATAVIATTPLATFLGVLLLLLVPTNWASTHAFERGDRVDEVAVDYEPRGRAGRSAFGAGRSRRWHLGRTQGHRYTDSDAAAAPRKLCSLTTPIDAR